MRYFYLFFVYVLYHSIRKYFTLFLSLSLSQYFFVISRSLFLFLCVCVYFKKKDKRTRCLILFGIVNKFFFVLIRSLFLEDFFLSFVSYFFFDRTLKISSHFRFLFFCFLNCFECLLVLNRLSIDRIVFERNNLW